MGKKSLQQVIKENKEFGFDPAVIQIAYANVGGDSERIIQEIFRLQQQSQGFPTKPSNPQDEDAQLSKAIQLSMTEAKDKKINLEPLNPQQRVRKSGVPVGLKNIGNTCYFNSLLQTYFQNMAFVRNILSYETPKKYKNVKDEDLPKLSQEDFDFKKKLSSCRLVQSLKQLFCNLIASDRKYIDPTSVLSSIVDDYGNELTIGDQKDIGEFNLVFLSRIQDGLEESRKDKQMDIQHGQKDNFIDSPSKINVFGKEESEGSLLRRSSIRIHQKSIIAEQFIGKIQNCFINDKEGINKSQQELFSLLFVNVKNKDLYKACEEITISHIDDYRNEKGEVIGVEKHSWIKEAPKTLFFQIDRVVYDKNTLTPQKINDIFDFPTVFYIDPFLHKNKETALKIQNSVRSLRQKKQRYLNALEAIEKYGAKKFNLLDILGETYSFFDQQKNSMDTENQLDNPTFIKGLNEKINNDVLKLLKTYQGAFETRVKEYRQKILQIQKEIEKAYKQINKTPYYLYSLLIHEGGADSGHYYSYTYDFQAAKWRKYNDINITEQVQENVLKEGKGNFAASAYYLVYAQKDVLVPHEQDGQKLLYKLSNEQGYLKDHYSSYLTPEQRNYINTENHQMYYDIQQYKMNSFATRVVDVYAKKFQTYNEVFRKTKIQKKKNNPPNLTSLPVFVKSIDEDEYKSLVIEQCINQYGPKEPSPIFEELLKKKLGNFNDFKKPKKFYSKGKHMQVFIKNYYFAIATKKLFESIQKEEYHAIFALLKELLNSDAQDYFNWLARLLIKIFVVRFLFQAERDVKNDIKATLQRLEMVAMILLKYINRDEEKMLYLNAIFWINEIMIQAKDGKEKIEQILALIDSYKYDNQYHYLELRGQHQYEEIIKSVDINDALWNPSRQENTVINSMLDHRERVKGKFESCNKLYVEMKKYNYPLKKEERDKVIKG